MSLLLTLQIIPFVNVRAVGKNLARFVGCPLFQGEHFSLSHVNSAYDMKVFYFAAIVPSSYLERIETIGMSIITTSPFRTLLTFFSCCKKSTSLSGALMYWFVTLCVVKKTQLEFRLSTTFGFSFEKALVWASNKNAWIASTSCTDNVLLKLAMPL
jgi:hypothetical protein